MKRICVILLALCLLLPAASLALQVGDEVTFGSYEQNGSREPIEWVVVKTGDGQATLISKYVLDAQKFSGGWDQYSASSIRGWLTKTFLNDAFTADEQSKLIPYTGNNDKVWLLHANEVTSFNLDGLGILYGEPTKYAITQGLEYKGNYCDWWLRGSAEYKVNIVSDAGKVSAGSVYPAPANVLGVRPAIVVKASALD